VGGGDPHINMTVSAHHTLAVPLRVSAFRVFQATPPKQDIGTYTS